MVRRCGTRLERCAAKRSNSVGCGDKSGLAAGPHADQWRQRLQQRPRLSATACASCPESNILASSASRDLRQRLYARVIRRNAGRWRESNVADNVLRDVRARAEDRSAACRRPTDGHDLSVSEWFRERISIRPNSHPSNLRAINDGARAATARIEQFVATAGVRKPGWTSFQGVLGRYGTNYVARAATARIAIGANPPEDAVYMSSAADASGQPLSGSMGYRMHFDASQLPPVLAFWSVTAYDESGYFIPNPINRYAIGDRDKLRFNPDGSLDLYIQSEDPGADRESNWLPSGTGPFNLTIRLYWPKDAILNGTWHPPGLVRVP